MADTLSTAPEALIRRLDNMANRLDELRQQLNDPEVLSNSVKIIAVTREMGKLQEPVDRYQAWKKMIAQAAELKQMAESPGDPEMAELAKSELPEVMGQANDLLERIKDDFVGAEDNAVDSFFMEIRAGTGGEEAALFARDLFEMYRKYADKNGWSYDVSDLSTGERGGFKEVIINVKGNGAFRRMRFEAGGHRVQRVPETESQGRVHTSAATVAVLPELPDIKIHIDPKDVEECGCRGGGPGGQNVNKVETGWQLNHKPSGLRFKMTEYKSQSQNKERAWALLRATLYEVQRAKQHAAVTGARKTMMGSGDRSERIRTYNFPQNRCTDHRLGGDTGGEKNFNLSKVIEGELDEILQSLLELDKRQQLENLSESE